MILSGRSRRIPDLILLVGCFLAVLPRDARAASEIIATRLAPSSVSARYGPAVPVHPGSPGGSYLVPTETGMEYRGSGAVSDTLYGSFRTAGAVREIAWSGSTAYLLAGDRGIVAVDATDSTSLVAVGGHDHLGDLEHGAFAPSSATLAAATDATLYLFRETAPGVLDLIDTRSYQDGRRIVRVQARSDSFLVLSQRSSPTLRMFLTLYRVRSGAAPESLWEFQANGFQVGDLAWSGAIAFVAAGNSGILPFDTETRLAGAAEIVLTGQFVRGVDADSVSVVAIAEARTYAQFTRSGPKGATLTSEVDRLTAIEPFQISLVGGLAVISEDDQASPIEPDEVGSSLLEVRDVAQPAVPGRVTTTGTGRVRRVIWDQGFAYVADYTGGLRIYRGGAADTSLVGAFPVTGNTRVYDLAMDPLRRLVFLASGTGGLVIVDVADASSPTLVASLALTGLTSAVAFIDTSRVVVARRGAGAGVTFVDVKDIRNSVPPTARGNYAGIQDPRALAVRDTVVFVADEPQGVVSIGFGNLDAPILIGTPSLIGSVDLDLLGTRLIVGTNGSGVQVVDATNPAALVPLSNVPSPPVFGVTQQGQTAVALLGDGGVLAIDLTTPSVPRVRGVIQVPGFSRDAFWVGDTLLVAARFGLERFQASPAIGADPVLGFTVDAAAVLPRVTITWTVSPPPGAIGWNLYRDTGSATSGLSSSPGFRVNDSLLGPAARSSIDAAAPGGIPVRYRLEVFFADGSSRKAAEGTLFVGSNSALGRVYPNPYRPRNGQGLNIPYRVLSIDGGKSIELGIYELSGRLVRKITGTTAGGGGYGSVTWDGRDGRGRLLADGVYFARLRGPGIDDARQFILLR